MDKKGSSGRMGFTKSRIGRRPYRATTLLGKNEDRKPSDVFESWNGLETPQEESEARDDFLLGLADDADEFKKESQEKKLLKEKLAQAIRARKGEFAPGIPLEWRIKPIKPVSEDDPNEDWKVSVSMHPAHRRGDHIDLRLVDPKGDAHSWALPQPRMPEPGKSSYAVQQPTHSGKYALRKKPFEIPEGYGATRPGEFVRPLDVGGAEIVQADQNKIRFLTHRGKQTNEFVLRKIEATADDGKPMWALHNATKNVRTIEGRKIPLGKPRYRDIKMDKIDVKDRNKILQAKIDGSHVTMLLGGPEKPDRVFSYRPGKGETGLIEHTFKFPDYHKRKSPPELKGTVLRAEAWASQQGRAVPAERVGGLLNASVPKSRKMQQESGQKLRITAFDVVKHKGRDVTKKPYSERLKILREAVKKIPHLELPPMAKTQKQKERLIKRIREGKLPQTKEGVVQWDLNTPNPSPKRAKIRPDQDVYVRGVFVKQKGEARGHAGGFTYSHSPTGPIVGRVGTGFDHKMRQDMLKNPDKYVGRVAKVESQGVYKKTKALRAPSFKEWHIDKTDPDLIKGK